MVTVSFNELVDVASATNTANYTVTGVTVTRATMAPSGRTVNLTVSALVSGNVTVAIAGVLDRTGNTLASVSAPVIAPTYAVNYQITTAAVVPGRMCPIRRQPTRSASRSAPAINTST